MGSEMADSVKRRSELRLPRRFLAACSFPATVMLAVSLLAAPPPGWPARAASSLPTTCQAPLLLNLQPGEHAAGGAASGPVAPDIPLDPVIITLPLYPRAQPTTQRVPPGSTPSFGPYEKSASAAYLLPTARQTAIAWYVRAMGSCGYQSGGEGQATGGGTTWNSRDFTSPTIPNAQIELSFAAAPSGSTGTILVAYADVLSLPRRPGQSELTQGYRQVDITYRTG